MRLRRKIGLASMLFLSLSCKREKFVEAHARPNIIFLFTDDQSYKDVHALGNPEVITPTMDALVESGITFTNAYNMGGWNGAICVASRAMIISGRTVWNAQEISKSYSQNKELDKTWPRLMEKAGYETYMTGKWHVQAKPEAVFNHVGHVLRGMPFDTPEGYNRPQNENDTAWQPWKKEYGGYWKGGKHWSELVRDDALSFLDSANVKSNPFFMYIAFNAPHDPRQSPKEYVDMYSLDSLKIPESFLPEYPYNEAMGAGKKLRDEKLAPFPRTEYSVKVNRQEYYAITTHLDDQFKIILDKLKATGLDKNTYIFFTSDHGLSVGEHGLMGKQSMYDHSVRVPLVIVGPDIPKGKKIEHDVYLQDLMATTLDLADVRKPEYVEFSSLLPFINNEKDKGNYEAIYGCYEKSSQRMIRKDGYKLIVYPKISKILLYDLKSDPQELLNIADDPDEKGRIEFLLKDLIQLQLEMKDTLNLQALLDKWTEA